MSNNIDFVKAETAWRMESNSNLMGHQHFGERNIWRRVRAALRHD